MNLRRKVIALLMSLTMVLTYMPGLAFAVDGTESAQPSEVVQTDDTVIDTESATEDSADFAEVSVDGDVPVEDTDASLALDEQSDMTQQEEPIAPADAEDQADLDDEEGAAVLEMITIGGDSKSVKPDVDVADSDDLLMDYFNKEVAEELGINPAKPSLKKAPSKTRRASLGDIDGNIYDTLLSEIDSMISTAESGQSMEAVFTIDAEQMLGKTFNKTTVNTASGLVEVYTIPNEDYDAFMSFDSGAILNALLFDQPYKLFWFDKTLGFQSHMPSVSYYNLQNNTVKGFVDLPFYEFDFYVSKDYSASGAAGTFDLDPSRLVRVNTASDTAASIIANAASYSSPLGVLNYFRTEICEMTDYDQVAANTNQAYGDPWQMISVFDNDANTKVVCEGYSKAFQYLCDNCNVLSSAGIECDSVIGTMTGGTGAGAHMWNILHINGLNYIADITNCDNDSESGSVSVGYPDMLFLKGCMAGGSVADGYEYDCNGNGSADIHYSYTSAYLDGDGVEQIDDTTLRTFSEDELIMSENDYVESTDPDDPEQPAESNSIAFYTEDGSNAFEIYEGESAYISYEDAGNYLKYSPAFRRGDIIAVYDENGERSDYHYIDGEGFFYNYSTYDMMYLQVLSDQSINNPWTPEGSGYFFTLSYDGKSCTVPLTFKAKDDSFTTVEFLRGETPDTIEQYENQDIREPDIYVIKFKDGDQLILRSDSGAETVYEYDLDEDEEYSYFVNVDDPEDAIEYSEVSLKYNREEEWPVGTSHIVELWYHGHKTEITVNIVENPIRSITYKSADGKLYRELIAGVDGYPDEGDYDYYSFPEYEEGDQLIINNNGNLLTYTYEIFEDEDSEVFEGFVLRNSDGTIQDSFVRYDMDWESDPWQTYESHWEIGGQGYKFKVTYKGFEFDIPVEIVENPVESISYMPALPGYTYENINGEWFTEEDSEYFYYHFPGFNEGDMLRVMMKSGETVDYELRYIEDKGFDYFVNVSDPDDKFPPFNGRFRFEYGSDQYSDDPWEPGVHAFTLIYMGCETQMEYTIRSNPVEEVSFIRLDENADPMDPIQLVKGSDSYFDTEINKERYEFSFKNGDIIVLKDAEGNEFRYIAEIDKENNCMFYKEDMSDTSLPAYLDMRTDPISIRSEQDDSSDIEWEVGTNHAFVLSCLGQETTINVTITESEVPDDIVASGKFGADGDNLTWTLDKEGTLTISGTGEITYTDASRPWTDYNDSIVSVVIEEGVTGICDNGFYGMSFTSIELPDSLTSIGKSAFYSCNKLKAINLPAGITVIPSTAFYMCYDLETVTFEGDITSIGGQAFRYCDVLTQITLPASVKTIGSEAFENCKLLEQINLPDGITSIGSSAFMNCESLEEITLPSTLKSILSKTFYKCSSLIDITIPANVTRISTSAFAYCANLQEVTLEEGVTTIQETAFQGCDSLKKIYIPASVTSIPIGAFWNKNGTRPISGLTIYGVPESYAETYASENNIPFAVEGEHDHVLIMNPGTEPGCETTGIAPYWECKYCDAIFSDEAGTDMISEPVILPPAGHLWEEPAYTWSSNYSTVTATRICSRDSKHKETETAKTTSVVDLEPTFDTEGLTTYTSAAFTNEAFTVQTKQVTVPALTKKLTFESVKPLATMAGNDYINGNSYFMDGNKYIVTYKDGHTETYTCITKGSYVGYYDANGIELASQGYSIPDGKIAEGDNQVTLWIDPGDGRLSCSVTVKGFTDEDELWDYLHIHKMKHYEAVAPTCSKPGNNEYWYCAECNCYFSDDNGDNEIEYRSWIIPATGDHSWDAGVVTKEPDCTDPGVMTYTCTECGATKTESIAALGHIWDSGIITKRATTEEDGEIKYTCTRCGEETTEIIPKLSDDYAPVNIDAEAAIAAAETAEAALENASPAEEASLLEAAEMAAADAVTKAETAVEDAQSAVTSAQTALDTANAELASAQAALDGASPEEQADAEARVAAAQAEVETAEGALNTAKQTKADAVLSQAKAASVSAKVSATAAVSKAKASSSAATTAASGTADAVNKATAAANDAAVAQEAAEASKAAAEIALEAAKAAGDQDAVNAANNALTAAETVLADANTALVTANNNKAAAVTAYNTAVAAENARIAEAQRQAAAAAALYASLGNAYEDPTLPKVSIKAPKKAKKAFTPKWKKLSKKNQKKVAGIEYEYSMDPYFTTGNVFKTAGKKSAGGKKIKVGSKQTYYVRAHTYVYRDGVKYVSPWSKTKKVKTK